MTNIPIIIGLVALGVWALGVGLLIFAAIVGMTLHRKRNADYDGMEFEEPPSRSFWKDGE